MATYVVTGVSRGIGYEFLRLLSTNEKNIILGIVRNKSATHDKIQGDSELRGRSNIHLIEADITDYNALQQASECAAKITDGAVDYVIANAGLVTPFGAFESIGKLGENPQQLEQTMKDLFNTNAIANVHLFNLFLPLVRKGQAKKLVAISSCLADIDFTNDFAVESGPLYAVSKAAVNMVIAKFNAQYKKEGILFLSICPGMVNTGHYLNPTPEQLQGLRAVMENFTRYAPNFVGSDTPENAARAVQQVWESASIENGNGGEMLSHYGNKQWL
ncbi:hypothetical protein NLG97_g990 [Lecanicillium saksenae]|uniref:Uncharacterized protein n=1 Tax=Lecanicillium saksenae TaxID=468837 RepID=A0ACC1R7Q2_9HYPO|nr:hypothetical protein NLG97_g990 [Lecanicillium saksenae]